MGLQSTPTANRLHIGLFGRRNSGKSSLINAVAGQNIAVVSSYAGTTTDPVYKAMEISPIGACMLIDTPGFDDTGELGLLRVEKTRDAMDKTDVALMLFANGDVTLEADWIVQMKRRKIPVIGIISKGDVREDWQTLKKTIEETFHIPAIIVSAKEKAGIAEMIEAIAHMQAFEVQSITAHMVKKKDVVLLVMPQDINAPKGRLILPQVQTIRDLLDNHCVVMSCVKEELEDALMALKAPPKLMITDSQIFKEVYEKKPKESKLTSFSILFAAYKGELATFIKGAQMIDHLKEGDRVLIAEACTHAPMEEDIGRVKIPNLLKRKIGEGLKVDVVSGNDFPLVLSSYQLIVHCGGCMFNRQHVLNRIARAKEQGVAISNYGVVLAKLMGILEKIDT